MIDLRKIRKLTPMAKGIGSLILVVALLILGSFAILLGLWRLTYGNSITILFPDSPMTLGYINISALFLVSMPMAMFSGAFAKNNKLLLITSCAGSFVSVLVLLLQVLGIMELREMLTVSHIMLVATICVVFVDMWRQRKQEKQKQHGKSPFVLIGIGIMLTLTLIGATHLLTPLNVILYQLVWSIPGILMTEWTRLI